MAIEFALAIAMVLVVHSNQTCTRSNNSMHASDRMMRVLAN